MMYCAECGNKMFRSQNGSWVMCCAGIGYWWSQPPMESDKWIGMPRSYRGHWFYKTVMWPEDKEPVTPLIDVD